jgi:ubiquinol-cytochrome c reductase subunit 6
LTKLKELCGEDHACEPLKHRLQECTDRVNSKPWTKETCNEELLDFLHCVDECVRRKKITDDLFSFHSFLVDTTYIQIREIIIKLETFMEFLVLDICPTLFPRFPMIHFFFVLEK